MNLRLLLEGLPVLFLVLLGSLFVLEQFLLKVGDCGLLLIDLSLVKLDLVLQFGDSGGLILVLDHEGIAELVVIAESVVLVLF